MKHFVITFILVVILGLIMVKLGFCYHIIETFEVEPNQNVQVWEPIPIEETIQYPDDMQPSYYIIGNKRVPVVRIFDISNLPSEDIDSINKSARVARSTFKGA